MFRNRISRLAAYSPVFASAGHLSAATSDSPVFGSQASANVMVTWTSLALWQQQLYRMAYEQALVDTAQPRHNRLLMHWN